MCLLLETIQIFDSELQLLPYHNRRFNKSRARHFSITKKTDLKEQISITKTYNGKWKCRVLYDSQIQKTEITPYQPKLITSFKIIAAEKISYNHKYADRKLFENLLQQNKEADEIIIIKKGLVTDSSYSNLAFFDGKTWFTPRKPLLKGVRREYLLKNKLIQKEDISVTDIFTFKKIALINAMNDLGEAEYSTDIIIK